MSHCLPVLCEEDQCPQDHSLHSLVPLMGREGAAQQVYCILLHYGLQQQHFGVGREVHSEYSYVL